MRPEITDRYYRVFTYQPVDRVPDLEFGYWPQTIRRWLKEGMPLEMTPDETNNMWAPKVDRLLGLEYEGTSYSAATALNPCFEHKVIERKEHSTIAQQSDGIICEFFDATQDESSIPHFLEFPVKTPADWEEMKTRYRLDDPCRLRKDSDFNGLRDAIKRGSMVTFWMCGFYGQLRNLMGFENLSVAFYDYPEMIREMVWLHAELVARTIETSPADIPVDQVSVWEDMASKNGPFVSPKLFREVFQPGYHRVMEAAKKRGCVLGIVDCDGNPLDIVPNWLEENVNVMFPLEIAAGVDPLEWRKRFGKQLLFKGGVNKVPLAQDRKAIDAEIERLKPLLDDGGFIPHVDHLVPPDISWSNYCYYREKKLKLIGK